MKPTQYFCPIENKLYELPANCVPSQHYSIENPEKSHGVMRYKHPKQGRKHVKNFVEDVLPKKLTGSEMVELGKQLNQQFYGYEKNKAEAMSEIVSKSSLHGLAIEWRNSDIKKSRHKYYDGDNKPKSNFYNTAHVLPWATNLSSTPIHKLTVDQMEVEFHKLTPSVQENTRASFAHFIRYLRRQNLLRHIDNPFISGSENEIKSQKHSKLRKRLTKAHLRAIRLAASSKHEWLVDCIDLCFLLGLRRQDLVSASFDSEHFDYKKGVIKIHVQKSENLRNDEKEVLLVFNRNDHPEAFKIIDRRYKNRALKLVNGEGKRNELTEISNYLIYRKPNVVPTKIPEGKTQITQITPDYVSKIFGQLRDSVLDIHSYAKQSQHRPTFHEIRSLHARVSMAKGASHSQVQENLAHSRKVVTDTYLDYIQVYPKHVIELSDMQGAEVTRMNFDDSSEKLAGELAKG